jgi:pimeloyl-ACP methyl ester carboxylesterase
MLTRTPLIAFLMMLAAMLAGCSQPNNPEQPVPRFEIVADGQAFPVLVPSAFGSTQGWLVVAENRSDPQSAEIKLPVAIVRARKESGKNPVVYLSGGPGTYGLSPAAYPGAYPWLDERDFVVFGQRGTPAAKPALMCPEYREAVVSNGDQPASIKACRERLTGDGIGIEHYHSTASAADLEDLRTVLEVDKFVLYGVSYGTRLALTYARNNENSIESMVLDSPLPPNAIYDDESARNLETSLRAIAADCALQTRCNQAFGDLEKRFFTTIDATSAAPIKIEGSDGVITGADLASLPPSFASTAVRQTPLIMDAVARLDPQVLADLATPPQVNDFAWGMRLSVWCSEALPFSERLRNQPIPSVLGGYESAAIKPELCEAWDVPPLDADVIQPVVSDIPTLIIAGEFDPLTPPSWGELAVETLKNSLVVSVRGGAHLPTQKWDGDGCAMALATGFVENPERILRGNRQDYCVFSRGAPAYLTEAPSPK